MAVAPVFDVAIPVGSASLFTNGERGLCPAAAVGAVPNGTYYLAKKLQLPPGVYFLKALIAPGGSITIGGQTLPGGSLIQTQIDVPPGEQRIDITLQKAVVADCFAAFLIFLPDRVIYTSNAEGWVFDTAALASSSIPAPADARLDLPVFTVRPNWADGVNEWVSYLTDVMTGEHATEQRRSVREFPRRMFEASFLRSGVTRSRLDNFIGGIGRREFLMPIWHEQYSSKTGVVANEAFQQFPTSEDDGLSFREFEGGDVVLIDLGDPADYELAVVSTVDLTTNRLNWSTRPARSWPAGVRLTPLRKARFTDAVSMDNATDRIGAVRLRFMLTDPLKTFIGDWGGCSPLWQFKVNRANPISTDFDRMSFNVDNQSGPVVYSDPGNRLLVNNRVELVLRGRRVTRKFREFVAAARGRAVRFYAPAFTQGIQPFDDEVSGSFLYAHDTGFAEVFTTPQDARKMIAVVLKDDSPTIFRTITSVFKAMHPTQGVPVEVYQLDAQLPPIETSLIERIEFIVPSRFDQDSFEFSHPVDASAAIGVSTALRSTEIAGMPPILCDVTSTIYPVMVSEDAIEPSLQLLSGILRQAPLPVDGLDLGVAFTAGLLRAPLVSYNAPGDEALNLSISFEAGVLRQPLVSYTERAEGLDVSMQITAGVLAVKLLTYTERAEALDVSVSFNEGRLHGEEGTLTWDDLDFGWDETEETWDNTPLGI